MNQALLQQYIPTVLKEFPTSLSDAELEAFQKHGIYSQITKVYTGIKIYLDFYKKIISSKAILDSPQTHLLLQAREDSFSSQYFLAQVRAAVWEFVSDIWQSTNFKLLPPSIVKSVVELTSILLKGESEPNFLNAQAFSGNSGAEREMAITQLSEMGFSQSEALEAINWVGFRPDVLLMATQYLVLRQKKKNNTIWTSEMCSALQQSDSSNEYFEKNSSTGWDAPSNYDVKSGFPEAIISLALNRKILIKSCFVHCIQLLKAFPSLSHNISQLLFNTVQTNFLSETHGAQALLRYLLLQLKEMDWNSEELQIKATLHVMGLLLNNPPFIRNCKNELNNAENLLLQLLVQGIAQKTIWLPYLLLVLEGIFGEMDHVIPVSFNKHGKGERQIRYRTLLSENTVSVIYDHLLNLLQQDMQFETAIGLLRLLTRYTKSNTDLIEKLIAVNGISNLLTIANNLSPEHLLAAQSPIVIIFRHVLERENVLKTLFASEIQKSFSLQGRNSNFADVNAFIHNNRFLALRDPKIFIEVASELCYIPRYSTEGRAYSMPIAQKPKNTDQQNPQRLLSNASPAELSALANISQNPHRLSPFDLNSPSGVVLTLLGILYSKKDQKSASTEDLQREKHVGFPTFMQRIFLLQCLTELTSCFNEAKLEFVNFSRKGNKEVTTPSKPRATMLNTFLHDFIPLTFMDDLKTDEKKLRYYISNWSMATLVSLCTPTGEYKDDKDTDLLNSVRKFVLEGVARSFRDACQSSETALVRYSRLACLADLIFRLLTARANVSSDTNTAAGRLLSEEYQKQMSKLMIEKSFVSLLVGGLVDMDFSYPHSRKLVRVLLKPLKFLSKMASRLKIEPNDDVLNNLVSGNTEEFTAAFSSQNQSEDEDADVAPERQDTPDLFRNSSLGMFHGGIDEELENYESNDDDDEIYDDEEDYDEDDGSIGGSVIMDEDEEMNSEHRHSDMDVRSSKIQRTY